ncbi:MAG: L28 family ribosomal protein [Patescibacteria group bacterium]
MSRTCSICKRGPSTDASRSHSKVHTLKRQFINLQTKTISGKRVKVCTRCSKAMKKK